MEAADILQHDGFGAAFVHQAEGFGEKVALVVGAELFSCFREGRTGNAAGFKNTRSLTTEGELFQTVRKPSDLPPAPTDSHHYH